MLVEVLSCRVNMSQSGMGARHAGAAIGADLYLPNMATPEFLACLSKQALQRTASANRVAPRNTGKETRAALIAQVGSGSFVHPAALFPPTAKELEARRRPASLVPSEGEESEEIVSGKYENDAGDGDAVDGEDTDHLTRGCDEPGENEVSPTDAGASGYHNAA
jgi:ParB family chromosome partitioning protein